MQYLSPPNSLFLQGLQSYQQNQLVVSASIFHRTLERFRQIGDRYGEAKTLYYLGLNHEALNQIAPALDYYEQFLVLAETLCYGSVFEHRARADQVTKKVNQLQGRSTTA
jgi:tetratricopeptide (TPR) repeat protein